MAEGVAECEMIYENGEPVDFVYLRVNPAFYALTALPRVEGLRVSELIPGIREKDPELLRIYGRVAAGGAPERFQFAVTSLGKVFDVSAYQSSPGCFTAIFEVIDEKIRTQRQLEEEHLRLDLALEAANLGAWEWEVQTGKLHWSEGCYKVTGTAPTELTLEAYAKLIHPDDLEGVMERGRQAVTHGGTYRDEYRVVLKDGSVRWLLNHGKGIIGADGKPQKLLGTVQDITEYRTLQASLLRTQRMESISRLAAGLAHDLNNDLTPILSGISILKETLRTPEQQSLAQTVLNSARHGAEIIRNLLAFSRGTEGRLVSVDVEAACSTILTLVRETFPKNICISEQTHSELPRVLADTTQLRQVLLNICINARDAMPDGGSLDVSLSAEEVTPATPATCRPQRWGRHVCITVSDTGTGITPENLEHIFDPFFSTKAPDKGSGLGLPSALGIVRGYRGFLHVESTPGRGSTFRVYIPAEA